MVKTAILYDFWFSCWSASCLRDAEDAELEVACRRAVAGCAEVWNLDVHVGDVELSPSVQFGENRASRLGVGGVFVAFKTGSSKFPN